MQTLSDLTIPQFRKALAKCSGKRIVLDTETTGLLWFRDHLTTVGFHCPEAEIEGTIDFGAPVPDATIPELAEFEEQVRKAVTECLKPGTTVIMHNSKFDAAFLRVNPIGFNGWHVVDTPVMIHLLDSRLPKGLEKAEQLLLGSNSKRQHVDEAQPSVEITKKGKVKRVTKKVWLWESGVRQKYCVNDTRVTYQLAETIMPTLEKRDQKWLFNKEMNYLKLVYEVEYRGVLVDPEFIGNAIMLLQAHLQTMEQELYDACGYKFNWRSNMQLSKALYENLGIERPVDPFADIGNKYGSDEYVDAYGIHRKRIVKGGQYNKTATSTFILMEKVKHPLGELISSIRESSKLVKTLNKWLELMDENCCIHTDFNLTGTRTGRLSSKKPPLQNIPSDVRGRFTQGVYSGGVTRKEEYNLRNALVARPGYSYLSIDYKTMEMCFFGQESGDEALLEFIAAGRDIHGSVAQRVWGDCGKEQNKIHREWSKTISFSLLYGMTTGSLQHKLNMTFAQAKKLTDDYWGSFPRIRPWLYETIMFCKEHGYVQYWSGRRWYEEVENFFYRGANALIQGGCADMLSVAALRCDKWAKSQPFDVHIVSFIHDELLFELETPHVEYCADALSEIMTVPDIMGLPFKTECKVGSTYGDLQDMRKVDGKWKFVDKSEVY